jgi:hypothetical protein
MNINDIKTLTIVGNKVAINNIDNEVSIFIDDNIDAVQYHKGYKLLEEPLMNEVEFSKYQDFIDLWQSAEDKKNRIPTEEEIAQIELETKISEAKSYLQSTDFYYIRKIEIAEDIPTEVVSKRIEAREFIRANEGLV